MDYRNYEQSEPLFISPKPSTNICELDSTLKNPVIITNAYGIGDKIRIAFLTKKHREIAIDCFRNCMNQIVCSGAKPLSFTSYIACEKNNSEIIDEINNALKILCEELSIPFTSSQIEEIPDLYKTGEYQILGFGTGIVEKERLITGNDVALNDVIVGIKSSGLHNSGFAIVQKMIRPSATNILERIEKLQTTLGEELIKPSKCYIKSILNLIEHVNVKGISYVTNGGIFKSISEIIPNGLRGEIIKDSFPILPVFEFISSTGSFDSKKMFNNFNMGIGMVVIVAEEDSDKTIKILTSLGEEANKIGKISLKA